MLWSADANFFRKTSNMRIFFNRIVRKEQRGNSIDILNITPIFKNSRLILIQIGYFFIKELLECVKYILDFYKEKYIV